VPAISDTGPLIRFTRIGRLDILQAVYGEILAPSAVLRELEAGTAVGDEAEIVRSLPWTRIEHVPTEETERVRQAGLGDGESETIALALGLGGQYDVILDDRKARRYAHRARLPVIGSGGVLILAKDDRIITEVRPLLDALMQAGLYLGSTAYHRVLEKAGEAPLS
jgi:predicted nucleic acid-binding protein